MWLEVVGLDAMGRPVSFGGAVHIHWASPWDTQTFATSLQPKGGEARFEVRVRSFAYQEGAPTKG